LDILCTFTNGNLHIIQVLEREGSPLLTKSTTNTLEMAKDFLSGYKQYSGKSFYDEMNDMLDNVVADKILTTISGDKKLEVTASGSYITFRWTYIHNGVSCEDKCVVLAYANGFLKYFVDTWNLYKIGNTAINLSEEQAVAIAMEQAKAFSWKVGEGDDAFEVDEFNVTTAKVTRLTFCNSRHADEPRSDDLLQLYPIWRIGVSLDKFYPGNVYGICVDIWADTREVRCIREISTNLDPELIGEQLFADSLNQETAGTLQSNLGAITWATFAVFAIVLVGIALILSSKKKFSYWSHRLPKFRSFRVRRELLCFLLLSMLILIPVLKVNAISPVGRFTVWGSTYGKSGSEVYQQLVTSNSLYNQFGAHGYEADNYRGSQTQKDWIRSNMSDDWPSYSRVAVVYLDHGVGNTYHTAYGGDNTWHYHVLDNDYDGNASDPTQDVNRVFDMDIYKNTTNRQHSLRSSAHARQQT